jgi:hypothetical protein
VPGGLAGRPRMAARAAAPLAIGTAATLLPHCVARSRGRSPRARRRTAGAVRVPGFRGGCIRRSRRVPAGPSAARRPRASAHSAASIRRSIATTRRRRAPPPRSGRARRPAQGAPAPRTRAPPGY